MKIFVTGATGFIGSHFCRTAIERGHQILALSRSAKKSSLRYRVAIGSLDQVPWGEIRQFKPDAVLHMAWVATPGEYLTSSKNGYFLKRSCELFEGMARLGVRHIVGVGTCLEYAPSDRPLQEYGSSIEPASAYARSKVAAWLNLEMIAKNAGITSSWLRVFYPYGPGEHPDRFPSLIMARLSGGGKIELKTPNSRKDYVEVGDAVDGVITVIEKQAAGIFNIGSGKAIRIVDLATKIAMLVGAPKSGIAIGDPCCVDLYPLTVADTSRLRSLGWSVKTSLRSGIRELWNSLPKQETRM